MTCGNEFHKATGPVPSVSVYTTLHFREIPTELFLLIRSLQKHPCVVVVTDRVTKRSVTGRWITRIERITEVQIYLLVSHILVHIA